MQTALGIDKDNLIPVREQLKSKLLHEIREGVFSKHQKLPSVRELSVASGVSLVTMQRVITSLEEDGVCTCRSRAGVYINRENLSERCRKILLIHFFSSPPNNYVAERFQLAEEKLYGDLEIQTQAYPRVKGKSILSPGILDDLRTKKVDCLLVNMALGKEDVLKLLDLSMPVIFLGDFLFGEIDDPRINQIREDTGWRAENFVQKALQAGYRDQIFVGGDPKQYYVQRLKESGVAAAKEAGVKFRFFSLYFEDQKDEACRERHFKILIRDIMKKGIHSTAIYFDAHPGIRNFVKMLDDLGIQHPRDYRIFMRDYYLEDSVYFLYDTSRFAGEAAKLIRDVVFGKKTSLGRQTILNGISTSSTIVNKLKGE